MCGAIVETHPGLRAANGIGKGAAARNHDHTSGAAGDRLEPVPQMAREGMAASELEHRQASTITHSIRHVRASICRHRIELVDLGHLRAPLAPDLDADAAGPDVEL